MSTDRRASLRRGLWFVGLWAAGVLAMAATAGALRLLMGAAT